MIADLDGALPGLIPSNYDSVPIMMSGLVYSRAVWNSAFLSKRLRQLMFITLRFCFLGIEFEKLCCVELNDEQLALGPKDLFVGLLINRGLNDCDSMDCSNGSSC